MHAQAVTWWTWSQKARRVGGNADILEEEDAVQEEDVVGIGAEGGNQRHVERVVHGRGEGGAEVDLRNSDCTQPAMPISRGLTAGGDAPILLAARTDCNPLIGMAPRRRQGGAHAIACACEGARICDEARSAYRRLRDCGTPQSRAQEGNVCGLISCKLHGQCLREAEYTPMRSACKPSLAKESAETCPATD